MLLFDAGLFYVNFNSGAKTEVSFANAPKVELKFNKGGVALFPTCDHLSLDALSKKRQLLSEIAMTVGVTLPQPNLPLAPAGVHLAIDIQVDLSLLLLLPLLQKS